MVPLVYKLLWKIPLTSWLKNFSNYLFNLENYSGNWTSCPTIQREFVLVNSNGPRAVPSFHFEIILAWLLPKSWHSTPLHPMAVTRQGKFQSDKKLTTLRFRSEKNGFRFTTHRETILTGWTLLFQVILRDAGNPGVFAFFIRSGQCQVIQEMTLVRRTPTLGKRRLILPPVDTENRINPAFKVKNYDRVKTHFLVICRLEEGHYFGVGENFSKMSIVSVNKVRT